MKKITVVNAFGRSNRGDSVLLDECLSEIRASEPGCQISVALFEGVENARTVHPDVRWSERLGNSMRGGVIGRLLSLWYLTTAGISIVSGSKLLDRMLPSEQIATLKSVRECDILISAPGGYIHDTNFAYIIALFHIFVGGFLGKIVILAPQSIGPIDGRLARWLARAALGKATYICPRETFSKDFLVNSLKISPQRIFPAGDSAFWNDEVETSQKVVDAEWTALGISSDTKVFGLTVVGWSFPKSSDPRAAYAEYIQKVAQVCDYVSQRYGLVPVILNQVSDDIETALKVKKLATCHVVVDNRDHEPWVLRALISRCSVFLGTRFHSCIFAMMAGRATHAIAYLPKTRYIMEDLQLNDRHYSIDELNVDAVISGLCKDLEDAVAAENVIVGAVTAYRSKFSRLQDVLRAVATN